jgi:hypothetical protein
MLLSSPNLVISQLQELGWQTLAGQLTAKPGTANPTEFVSSVKTLQDFILGAQLYEYFAVPKKRTFANALKAYLSKCDALSRQVIILELTTACPKFLGYLLVIYYQTEIWKLSSVTAQQFEQALPDFIQGYFNPNPMDKFLDWYIQYLAPNAAAPSYHRNETAHRSLFLESFKNLLPDASNFPLVHHLINLPTASNVDNVWSVQKSFCSTTLEPQAQHLYQIWVIYKSGSPSLTSNHLITLLSLLHRFHAKHLRQQGYSMTGRIPKKQPLPLLKSTLNTSEAGLSASRYLQLALFYWLEARLHDLGVTPEPISLAVRNNLDAAFARYQITLSAYFPEVFQKGELPKWGIQPGMITAAIH